MDSLPTEILEKILGYLPIYDRVRVERVCKRWKNVSTARVWRDVQVLQILPKKEAKNNYQVITFYTLMELSKDFGDSIKLNCNKIIITVTQLVSIQSFLSRAGQHIKELIIAANSECTPIEPLLSIIANYCTNIETIKLHAVEDSGLEVLSRLLDVNKQLRSFTCSEADNVIEILPLRDYKSLNIQPIVPEDDWDKGLLIALIENSPSLEELHVYCWTPKIIAVIPKCKQLKTLCFEHAFDDSEPDAMINTSLLDRLTCLKLCGAEADVNSMVNLLGHCTNLETLIFNDFSYVSLEVIQAALALPKLESLEISASSITDEILSHLLKFKRLKLTDYAQLVTENGIFQMIMKSECLEELEIPDWFLKMELFERLSQSTIERRKILKFKICTRIYKDALKICEGSKIHIIEDSAESFYSFL